LNMTQPPQFQHILALDPGTTETGMLLFSPNEMRIIEKGIFPNPEVSGVLDEWVEADKYCWQAAIEMIASYGMPVGKETFETCVWIGRFIADLPEYVEVRRVYRKDVKSVLCGSMKAKDGNVRQALIDRFPATGTGKTPQIGLKACQGPLFGVKSHLWAALGVAVAASELWDGLEGF
jgi:hypothetical protein